MAVVKVRLFAALRDLADASEVEAVGADVRMVVDDLCARFGERFAAIARSGTVVVDGERARPDTPIADGQEVALLPPVSGGSRRA
jgi:molybdopterin synthase catalytic subunit